MTELERALTDLGAHLQHPPTPPLAEAVMARLAERPAPGRAAPSARRTWLLAGRGRPAWRRWAVAALALLVLAAGIVVATPGARDAVARRLGLRGVAIHLGGPATTASTRPPGVGANLALGRRVTLEQARAGVSFPVLVPTAPGFEHPDAVYLSRNVPGGRVDLVYRARQGLPSSPFTDVGLLITQFQAEPMVEKTVTDATTLERVVIDGEVGYWFGGEPHSFAYLDRNRALEEETSRLAGSTLVWTHRALTLRLEGQVTKRQALRIASSMR
jgi:hypothetical protein